MVALSPYIYATYVCFKKGKDGFAWLGIAGLLLPILDWFAIVGAIRIAKPDSEWARSRCGAGTLKQAMVAHRWPTLAAQKEAARQSPQRRKEIVAALTRSAGTGRGNEAQ